MENEIWKDVVGYEGLYKVSNLGRAKSLKRLYRKNDKIVSTKPNSNGYTLMRLYKDKIHKCPSLHRLVAQAFIPNPENKPYINHIDNNPSNNRVENLEWCTQKENMQHASKQGRCGKKSICFSTLDYKKVRKIRELFYGKHLKLNEIASIFNINRQAVDNIIKRKTWGHVV